MIVSRIAYLLMTMVIAAAIVAIVIILRPNDASSPPTMDFQTVLNYSQFGVIDKIEQKDQTLTVHFKKDFDTQKHFNTDTHTFEATVPESRDLLAELQAVGVPVGEEGVQVISR